MEPTPAPTVGTVKHKYMLSSDDCDLGEVSTYEKVFEKWDHYVKNPRKLRKIVRGGVPNNKIRIELWERFAECKGAAARHPGLYHKLAHAVEDNENESVIRKDLHRTYPNYELFAKQDGPGQTALLNVLKAYSFFDSQVGYVQGMAFIAGFIYLTAYLAHYPNQTDNFELGTDTEHLEETTFWLLVQLMNHHRYAMKDVYRTGLPRLRMVMFMVDKLLNARAPEVREHLNEQYLSPDIYVSPFMIALFANRFPYKTSLRFFDIFFCEGWKLPVRTMVALLKHCKQDVLKKNTAEIIPHLYKVASELQPQQFLDVSLGLKVTVSTINDYIKQYEESLPEAEKEKIAAYKESRKQIQAGKRKSVWNKVFS